MPLSHLGEICEVGIFVGLPVAGPRRRRPLGDTWNYILNKTTHRARGHSRRSAAPTASRAFAHSRPRRQERECEGAERTQGRRRRRGRGRREQFSACRSPRQLRTRRPPTATPASYARAPPPKLAPRRAHRSANTAPKGSAQQHRNHCAHRDARARLINNDVSARIRRSTTAPPHRHAPTAQIRTTTAVAPPKSPNFG